MGLNDLVEDIHGNGFSNWRFGSDVQFGFLEIQNILLNSFRQT
jgi:hypothetical protein